MTTSFMHTLSGALSGSNLTLAHFTALDGMAMGTLMLAISGLLLAPASLWARRLDTLP
ncbi:hypothetical protein [Paraburkholderia xenovorans]|uniref:hypothetical protein n=1 Tax=Paraburkholderia xenovorans TaxID=36873 RepID=UPI00130E1963|nr:hypothetical protein [Paraburkholderia xenovorans]